MAPSSSSSNVERINKMPILRLGNQIRLTGEDAVQFQTNTGQQILPKTIKEHNQAIQETIDYWTAVGSAEALLLVEMIDGDLIE